MIHIHRLSDYHKSCGSGFLDSLSAHSIYLHCPDLGHINNIGVRGERTTVKQFMYLHPSVI